jgi:hypothetical protein
VIGDQRLERGPVPRPRIAQLKEEQLLIGRERCAGLATSFAFLREVAVTIHEIGHARHLGRETDGAMADRWMTPAGDELPWIFEDASARIAGCRVAGRA